MAKEIEIWNPLTRINIVANRLILRKIVDEKKTNLWFIVLREIFKWREKKIKKRCKRNCTIFYEYLFLYFLKQGTVNL